MSIFRSLLSTAIILLAIIAHGQEREKSAERPNIILFLVDDLGWADNSLRMSENIPSAHVRYRTPNMERLAASGLLLTSAYATPVCTPSRVSMITGLNAAHHHVVNWTSPWKDANTDNSQDQQMSPARWNLNGLSPDVAVPNTVQAQTFPALLAASGYFTIHVGKAHWGPAGTPGSNPYNLGFMVNVAGHAAGHPQSYLSEENFGNPPQKTSVQAVPDLQEYHGSGTFLTDALTREALKALEAPLRNRQPFFLHLSHYAVHIPLMADKRYLQHYLDMGLDSAEAAYATLVEGMDKSVGEVMDYLKRKQVDRQTLIIFLSDNGGLGLTPPRGGKAHTHNLPLRSGKGSVYEGGIRVPMIVSWPGVVREGTRSDVPVMVDDLFPTILEAAGIRDKKAAMQADGSSIMPLLKGNAMPVAERSFIWHYPIKWIPGYGPGINYHSAIRKGDWKMVYDMRTGRKELYNLKDDLGEQRDLSGKEPRKLAELSSLLGQRLRAWQSPMPTFRTTGDQVPWPDQTGQPTQPVRR